MSRLTHFTRPVSADLGRVRSGTPYIVAGALRHERPDGDRGLLLATTVCPLKKVCLARDISSDLVDRETSGPLEWNENEEGENGKPTDL
jgi:hypothetical protein